MEQAIEKSDKGNAPSFAIDGSRIRSLREGKKLTQLYVASVVGVTTDTISRWENNRYPSIKRDNAEKLAGALEVPLEEILRQEEELPPPLDDVVSVSPRRRNRWLLFSVPCTVLLLLLAIFLFLQRKAPAASAVRWAPRFAAPGEVIPVQIKVARQAGQNFGFILKEKLPEGFRLVSALPASAAAESGSVIKWLIPGGSAPVAVSYTVQVPAAYALRNEIKLAGEIVLPAGTTNRTEAVAGRAAIRIGAYHWADANGDGRIDDDEIMPAYYICEEMKGLGLDWKTIEAIWSGKGYRWDQLGGFTVLK